MSAKIPVLRRWRHCAPAFAVSACLGALTAAGCGTTYTAAAIKDIKPGKPTTGVRYYLPQDVIQLTVDIQTLVPKKVETCTDAGCGGKFVITEGKPVTEPVAASVDMLTVADTRYAMMLDTNGFAFGKSDTIITVSEHGLLQSVNAKTQGTAGTVVQNLMKLAATVASVTASGGAGAASFIGRVEKPGSADDTRMVFSIAPIAPRLPLAAPTAAGALSLIAAENTPADVEETASQYKPSAENLSATTATGSEYTVPNVSYVAKDVAPFNGESIAFLTSQSLRTFTQVLEPSSAQFRKNKLSVDSDFDTCARRLSDDEFMKAFISDSKPLRMGFQELELKVRERLRVNVCDSLRALDAAQARLNQSQDALSNAATRDSIYVATHKVEALRHEYSAFLVSAATATSDLRTAADAKVRAAGFGTPPSVKTKKYTVAVKDLRPSQDFTEIHNVDFGAFRAAISKVMRGDMATFDEAALLLSVDDVSDTPRSMSINKPPYSREPSKCGELKAKAKPCIYHRIARPIRLTGWSIARKEINVPSGTTEIHYYMAPISTRVVDIVDSRSIVQALDLHSSSWTKRDFAVAFTPQGRLVSVKRDYGSSAEDASGALQQGLSGALGTYKDSLATVKSIRETENELDLMPLKQKLALANARGDLAVQPLAQQLAMANAQTSLDVQPVNAQLAQAKAQLDLLKAQATLEANNSGYAAAVQSQVADIEKTLATAQQQLLASQGDLATGQYNSQYVAETAAMNAEISRMKNEIELLKLRAQLEELKKDN